MVPALWALWAATFFGVGRLAARLVAAPALSEAGDAVVGVWLGVAAAQLALVAWSLVLPVNGAASAVLLLVGAIGLWCERRTLGRWLAGVRTLSSFERAAVLLVVLLVANRAVAPMVNYDSATYEFPGMAWAEAYPAVPGLANLHSRLGFNNANVLLAAAINRGPWPGHAHHLLNGLLVTLLAATLWAGARRAAPAARGALLCLIAPVIVILQNPEAIVSLTADTPATAFTVVAFALWLVALRQPPPPAAREILVLTIVACTVSAVTVKLSTAVVAASTALLTIVWWLGIARPSRRAVAAIGAVIVIGAATWLGRGVVLSGHPLYPTAILAVDLDWRVPDAARNAELDFIRVDNRYVYPQLPADVWPTPGVVGRWLYATLAFAEARASIFVPAILTLAGLVALVAEARVRRRVDWVTWAPVLPPLAGIVLWWRMAPTPEFGYFVFWTGAAATFGVNAGRGLAGSGARRGLTLAMLLGVAAAPLALDIERRMDVGGAVRATASALVWAPDLDLPVFPLQPYVTASGTTLTYPATDDRCGPVLLCTPHPAPNLVLRDANQVARGFRVDGAWQALWYPSRRITDPPYWRDLPGR